MAHNPYDPYQASPQHFSINPNERPYQEFQEAPAPRGGWTARLAFGALVVVLCAGGVWYGAHMARDRGIGGDPVLIKADTSPIKEKPPTPTGVADDEPVPTYDKHASDSGVEQLLPSPETPMARPRAVSQSAVSQSPVIPTPALPAPASLTPMAAAPPTSISASEELPPSGRVRREVPLGGKQMIAQTAPGSPGGAVDKHPVESRMARGKTRGDDEDTKLAMNAPPKAKQETEAGASAKARNGAQMTGPVRVQIAATTTPAAAQSEWHRLQRAHPDLLGTLTSSVARADLGSKGVFYRVQAGPLDNRAAAEKLCQKLKAVSIGCIVVK